MNDFKKVAIKAVKKSGKFLLHEYINFDRNKIRFKSHHEIVTRADLMSEEIIIGVIKDNYPHHSFLSEESGASKDKSNYLWVIDPLDGTTNFSMHNPLWSISVSLVKDNEFILGIIYAPFMDEMFVAEKDRGAILNNKKIKVSKNKSGKILSTFCHGTKEIDIKRAIRYYQKQKLAQLDCRQMGSAAIELAFVAAGRTESFVAPGARDWDVAAGVLLVREAGGIVTDFKGEEWQIGSGDILASNGYVHREILKKIYAL